MSKIAQAHPLGVEETIQEAKLENKYAGAGSQRKLSSSPTAADSTAHAGKAGDETHTHTLASKKRVAFGGIFGRLPAEP